MWEAWRVEALRCIERPEIGIYRHQYALRGIETGESLICTRRAGAANGKGPIRSSALVSKGVRRRASCCFFMHDCVAADLTQ